MHLSHCCSCWLSLIIRPRLCCNLSCGLRQCRTHCLLGKLTRWCCGCCRGFANGCCCCCCCCEAPGSVNADQRLQRAAQMHQLLLHLSQAGQTAQLLLLMRQGWWRWWQHHNHSLSGSWHWWWCTRREHSCCCRCSSQHCGCPSHTSSPIWWLGYAVH